MRGSIENHLVKCPNPLVQVHGQFADLDRGEYSIGTYRRHYALGYKPSLHLTS